MVTKLQILRNLKKFKETHKVDFNHTCLAVISLDCALNEDESYYQQVFLKICK